MHHAFSMGTTRPIIGLDEPVVCFGEEKQRTLHARIDTGAGKSSIDIKVAERLGVGPVIKEKAIRNAHGREIRKVIQLEVELAGKRISAMFTIADRKDMRYKVLIGRNVLKKGNFLVDPTK